MATGARFVVWDSAGSALLVLGFPLVKSLDLASVIIFWRFGNCDSPARKQKQIQFPLHCPVAGTPALWVLTLIFPQQRLPWGDAALGE